MEERFVPHASPSLHTSGEAVSALQQGRASMSAAPIKLNMKAKAAVTLPWTHCFVLELCCSLACAGQERIREAGGGRQEAGGCGSEDVSVEKGG